MIELRFLLPGNWVGKIPQQGRKQADPGDLWASQSSWNGKLCVQRETLSQKVRPRTIGKNTWSQPLASICTHRAPVHTQTPHTERQRHTHTQRDRETYTSNAHDIVFYLWMYMKMIHRGIVQRWAVWWSTTAFSQPGITATSSQIQTNRANEPWIRTSEARSQNKPSCLISWPSKVFF